MPGCNHLYRRGAAYWFRRRVPTDLLQVFDKTAWRESLGTADPEEAKRRCRLRAVETDREIAAARARAAATASPPLTPQEARALADAELASWLEGDDAARMDRGWGAYEGTSWLVGEFADAYRADLARGRWEAEADTAEDVLRRAGRWYARNDESFRRLAVELLKARVKLVQGVSARQQGEIVEAPAVAPIPQSQPQGVTLGHLIDTYQAERAKASGDEAVRRKYAHVFKALEEGLGRDRPIRSITRADCRSLRDLLAKMPAHMGKRYPGLSIEQASAAAARDGIEPISSGTLWSYLVNLSAVFNWAVDEEWLDKNPAKGIADRKGGRLKRRGFTPAELETLFSSLHGHRAEHPWRFWLPAMALYSGARAGELAQLLVGDVKVVDGRWCYDLSEFDDKGVRHHGKRLKTDASERVVPIHPAVIRAGFLRFVRSRGSASERLFPELKEGPNGGYSHELSRWFGRHLDRIGLSDPTLTFHGFRHGFRDAGVVARIPDATIDALGGWRTPGVGAAYGNRRALVPLLAAELRKIAYGGFRLPSERRSNRKAAGQRTSAAAA